MKLNWGHYIFITFSIFVALILVMVFESFKHNNDLVVEDYYAQELLFQDVIEKRERANALPHNISWSIEGSGIVIQYPAGMESLKGKIFLMRPSNKEWDRTIEIQADEYNRQLIKNENLLAGKYQISFDWSSDGISYFTEGAVYVVK